MGFAGPDREFWFIRGDGLYLWVGPPDGSGFPPGVEDRLLAGEPEAWRGLLGFVEEALPNAEPLND